MLNESNLYDNIAFRDDYAGIERVVYCKESNDRWIRLL